MTFHYTEAARRHHQDGKHLEESGRVPNADQLYGYAAECALIGIVRSLPNTDRYFGPDGSAAERQKGGGIRYHAHVAALWNNFRQIVHSHDGRTLMRGVSFSGNPFEKWNIEHRYFATAACNETDIVKKHRDVAAQLLKVLQEAETRRLKRAVTAKPVAAVDVESASPDDADGETRGEEAS